MVDVTGNTRITGLFGCPVHHSQSPAMHNAAFRHLGLDFIYVPFNVQSDDLGVAVSAIRAFSMVGVNLTIPHKEQVVSLLDWVDDDALKIGSVNTIVNDEGMLRGYSTDGYGFIEDLISSGKSPESAKVVVLGAGGSARAIIFTLARRGAAEIAVVNRTYSRALELTIALNGVLGEEKIKPVALDSDEAKQSISAADLLVNCTSVGMYPDTDAQPIPSDWLHDGLFVYDQIYNPAETDLLREAKKTGARTANGIGMLVHQGARSFELWTGQKPPVEIMKNAVLKGFNVTNR